MNLIRRSGSMLRMNLLWQLPIRLEHRRLLDLGLILVRILLQVYIRFTIFIAHDLHQLIGLSRILVLAIRSSQRRLSNMLICSFLHSTLHIQLPRVRLLSFLSLVGLRRDVVCGRLGKQCSRVPIPLLKRHFFLLGLRRVLRVRHTLDLQALSNAQDVLVLIHWILRSTLYVW